MYIIYLIIVLNLFSFSKPNETDDIYNDWKYIKFKKDTLIWDSRGEIAINFLADEIYWSYKTNYKNEERHIKYGGRFYKIYNKFPDTSKIVPFLNSRPVDLKGESKGLPNNYLYATPIVDVFRYTKTKIDYYRLSYSYLQSLVDYDFSLKNFAGVDLGSLNDSLNYIEFKRSDLNGKNFIRFSAPHQLVRLYELPEYLSIAIDTLFYQQLPWSYGRKFFWEKESGILYKTTRKDSLYAFRTLVGGDTVITTGDRRNSLVLKKGYEARILRRFSEYYIIGFALIFLIILPGCFFLLFPKCYYKIIDWSFPILIHYLTPNDTLASLSVMYNISVEDIISHNPRLSAEVLRYIPKIPSYTRLKTDLHGRGLLSIKIPKAKNYRAILQTSDKSKSKEFIIKKVDRKKEVNIASNYPELKAVIINLNTQLGIYEREIAEIRSNLAIKQIAIDTLTQRNNELFKYIETLDDNTATIKRQMDEIIDENHNLREKLNQFLT
jgi:hypothetical protein